MNRSIRRLGIGIVVLYLALFAKLNWIQVVDKQKLDENPLNTAQVRRDAREPGRVAGDEDQVVAARGELTSELQADPGGRAGDQGRTARGAGGTHGSSKPVLAPIRQPGPA